MEYMKYRQLIVGDRSADNINVDPTALIGFENRTGISAAQQRNSVGALRALSGYSSTTQDVLNVMQQNLNPAAANQQFMHMGGLSMYGPGGEPRDYMSVLNSRVKMFGMDQRHLQKGALREGSITRHRMGMAGISQDEQDLIIQLGQAQSTFREKGGEGTFDPTNKAHRKTAGIEDNFATQFDETERTKAVREEDMMRRQIDNFAALEKSNQRLTEALGSLEDKLSGLIGARTSTRNWMNIGGRIAQGVGMGLMASGVGVGPGAALLAAGTMATGDPPDQVARSGGSVGSTPRTSAANDRNIMVPFGYKGNGPGPRKPLSEVKEASIFKGLEPMMQERLLSMMRENPDVGIGGGKRSEESQRAEFLRRHRVTTKGNHDRVWDGKYWKLVTGAPFAPPGRSMHEIGLAADLIGDLDWMNTNASRFGLKHFAGVNGEPWHVQPAEYPNSRSDYEAGKGSFVSPEDAMLDPTSDEAGDTSHGRTNSFGGGAALASNFHGSSIQDIVDAYLAMGPGGGGATGGGLGGSSGSDIGNTSGYGDGYAGVGAASNYDGPISSGASAAARAAFQAGFRGDALATVVAIAGRESGWQSDAVNPNSSDRGMWQINWANFSKDYYSDFRKSQGIKGINDLLNINKNASAAYKMYQDSVREGRPWFPWRASDEGYKGVRGWDPDGDHMWHTGDFVGEASAAATAVTNSSQGGDPPDAMQYARMPKAGRPQAVNNGMGGVNVTNQYHIDFRPEFKFDGVPQTPQLQQVAKEAASFLREQVDVAMKRSE
jgi:hypothetical protein